MAAKTQRWCVPSGLDLDALGARLAPLVSLQPRSASASRRVYWDSLDARLARADRALVEHTADGPPRRTLETLAGALVCALPPLADPPRFAADLPAGEARAALAGLLIERAVLPRAEVTVWTQTSEVVAGERAVARLSLERRIAHESGRDVALPDRVVLERLGGRKAAFRVLTDAVERALMGDSDESGTESGSDVAVAVTEDAAGELATALGAFGRVPAPEVTGFDALPLTPKMSTAEGVRVVLRHLADELAANEAPTLVDLDPEALHEYRVAVRRTRAVLSAMREAFPAAQVARFRAGFKWLGTVTTPVRDLDVYLWEFPSYRERVSGADRERLQPLRSWLEARQRVAWRRLTEAMLHPAYRELLADWRVFLSAGADGDSSASGRRGARPLGAEVRARARKAYRVVAKAGRAIEPDSPPEALHELRKDLKTLRYLLELFPAVYEADAYADRLKALKRLQSWLGEYQDLEVHAAALHQVGAEMARSGWAPPGTGRAIERLVEALYARQAAVRGEFGARFGQFDAPDSRDAFKRLFRNP